MMNLIKTTFLQIKWHKLIYAIYMCGISLFLAMLFKAPSSSIFIERKPLYAGKNSGVLTPIIEEEVCELSQLYGIGDADIIIQMALSGNRCAAYLSGAMSFKNRVNGRNQVILAKLRDDENCEADSEDSEEAAGLILWFADVSASLGYSSGYYLMHLIYAEWIESCMATECLSAVYYLCWAEKNNLSNCVLQTKERMIYLYGKKVWEKIENISMEKLSKADKNKEEMLQALDKKEFVHDMISKNLIDEKMLSDDSFWTEMQ